MERQETDPNWAPPGDRYLVINSIADVAQQTNQLGVSNTPSQWDMKTARKLVSAMFLVPTFMLSFGSITFTVSNVTGIIPDITVGGTCALPVRTVEVLGQNQMVGQCPILSNPQPNPASCAFSMD